jgi:TatD DNase family protein
MIGLSTVIIPHMAEYIDIGVNLTGSSFKNDLDEVIQRAHAVGVGQMIVTGTDIDHSKAAIELCEQYPEQLYSTAGMHPHHADDYSSLVQQQLRDLCHHESVVAVGECGLDFNRNFSTQKNQCNAFESQLELATEVELPVFLHQRDAHDQFMQIIKNARPELGQLVAHCFTGTVDEAIDYLELDMYIGITGWICDERRGRDLQQAVKEIPLNRIMLETDAPYLLPRDIPWDLYQKPVKARRNEPCYLPHICQSVARHMGLEVSELARSAVENAQRFFNI